MNSRTVLLSALTGLVFAASTAFALDLQSAKSRGLVGEQPNGYIGAVAPSPDVNQLVSSINAQRRQAYANISKENGQPLNVVESLAAQKIYNGLARGEYYKSGDGSWKQK